MSGPFLTGLTFDSEDLQDYPRIYCWVRKGMYETPSVRGTDVIVPGLPGRFEGGRENDVLPLVLECHLTADLAAYPTMDDVWADFTDRVVAFRELMAPNRSRAALVAGLPDGSTSRTIQARPLNTSLIKEIPGEYVALSIEMEGDGDWVEAGS